MAAIQKFAYTVYDRYKEKDVLVNATAVQVAELTGLSASKVGMYANNNWVYDGQYLFTKSIVKKDGFVPVKEDISTKSKPKEKDQVIVPPELAMEWDRVRFIINPNARIMT